MDPSYPEPRPMPAWNAEIPFHCMVAAAAVMLTNQIMRLMDPDDAGDMPAPGAGRVYRFEVLIVSSTGQVDISVTDGVAAGAIWGPHRFPSGGQLTVVPVLWHADKTRSGKALTVVTGIPKISSAAPFTGRIDLFGFSVPALP